MTQHGELARVKARIKALAEKTVSNGCTEAEAMAAAEMVGRLLDRYALSMEEIDVRAARCVQLEVPIGGKQRRPIDGCVTAIARFCDCKVWVARDEEGMKYIFFGFEPDTSMAGYLYGVIDRAIRTELAEFKRRAASVGLAARRAGVSFQHGAATRVAERLEAMRDAREVAMAARRSGGTALIVVKHRVVDEAFADTKVRLVSVRRLEPVRMKSAFHEGVAAGERINLNRPVGGDAQGRLG
jgi:hypothetical protein